MKAVLYAACIVGLFLIIHGRFIAGATTVTWDTLAWSLGMQHVNNLIQNSGFIGWNPLQNGGEPLYIYHYAYAYWQWFAFALLNRLAPVQPIILFNIFLLFLYVFYNVGCYLVFLKVFNDYRVALFCLTVSIFSLSFDVYLVEHSSLYISMYFPYLVYFFLEFAERRSSIGLALIPILFGIAANAYVPHFIFLAFVVFVVSYFIFMKDEHYFIRVDRSTVSRLSIGLAMAFVLILPVLYVYFRMDDYISPVRIGVDNYMDIDPGKTGHHQELKALLQIFAVSSYTKGRALLYIGIVPLVLAGIGILKSANRFRWVVLSSLTLIFFISIGRNSFPYLLMHYLPTFSFMRHYIIFEIFVQFMMILLAGMGLEYLLAVYEKRRTESYVIAALGFSAIVFVYALLKFKEMKEGLAPLIHASMFLTMLCLAIVAVVVLIQNKNRNTYAFLMTVIILNAGSLQWYFSDLHFDLIQESKDANEKNRLAEVLNKDHAIKWNPMRQAAYSQKLKVANYNTFESVLDNYEESYWKPIERNLLVNKRYYTLAQMDSNHPEYFGVNHSKLFLTDNYSILPRTKVQEAMRDEWLDFIKKQKVFFAQEDVFSTGTDSGGTAHAANEALFAYNPEPRGNTNEKNRFDDQFNVKQTLNVNGNVPTLGEWSVDNEANADDIDISIKFRGALTMDTGAEATRNWADTLTAPYVYREFSGDFQFETHVSSNHHNENEFAGILIRNHASEARDENWITIESGSSGNESVNYIINTIDGISSVTTSSPADEHLRVERSGETILLYSRQTSDDQWTLRANFARPDFPASVQVGMTAQSDNTKDTFVARFDYFRGQTSPVEAIENGLKPVKVEKFGENRLIASVDSPRPSFLVYLQNYDKDWSAYINGEKAPIYRVNYAFQAVRVPKGESLVEFRYSSTYKYLLIFNLLTAFVSMGMMTTAFWRTRPEEDVASLPTGDDLNEVDE